MQLTLALGLQYNSYKSREAPTSTSESSLFALNKANLAQTPAISSVNPVLDVKPIAEANVYAQKINKQADYLTYNLHAGLIPNPNIGANLHITI